MFVCLYMVFANEYLYFFFYLAMYKFCIGAFVLGSGDAFFPPSNGSSSPPRKCFHAAPLSLHCAQHCCIVNVMQGSVGLVKAGKCSKFFCYLNGAFFSSRQYSFIEMSSRREHEWLCCNKYRTCLWTAEYLDRFLYEDVSMSECKEHWYEGWSGWWDEAKEQETWVGRVPRLCSSLPGIVLLR